MKHYFINLTNGIERLPELQETGDPLHFLRIRSTTLERKDWIFLLMDLDHNFLMHLALGKECVVVDYGTNRKNSKTCYKAVPLIRYLLTRRWYGGKIDAVRYTRSSDKVLDDTKHYEYIYDYLFLHDQNNDKRKLKRKLDYFKNFIGGVGSTVKLSHLCESTVKDGKYPYYAEIVKKYY